MQTINLAFVLTVLVALILFSGSLIQAQTDTTKELDKVHLKNGTVLAGKVKVVKTDIIEFVERDTDLAYELKKSEIKVIVLGSGKSITFTDEPVSNPNQPPAQTQQPVIIEKESGAPVGLIVLASVGAVLGILLLIGAAAQ